MDRKIKLAIGVVALAAAPGVAIAVKALDHPPSTRAEVAADVAKRFAEQDEDKDGRLIVRRAPPADATPPEDAAALFAMLDTDRNGQISPVEFAKLPERDGPPGPRHGPSGPRGPGPLERADANHDGFVTLPELRAEALARFDADDVNHDGKLSEEERRAAAPPPPGGPRMGR